MLVGWSGGSLDLPERVRNGTGEVDVHEAHRQEEDEAGDGGREGHELAKVRPAVAGLLVDQHRQVSAVERRQRYKVEDAHEDVERHQEAE